MQEKLDQYEKRFGDGFPTMCFPGCTDEQFIELIDECLESGGTARELFHLEDDVLY